MGVICQVVQENVVLSIRFQMIVICRQTHNAVGMDYAASSEFFG